MALRFSGAAAPGRIDYLAPDYDRPSWGVALLYEHVRLLRELGHEARVLHHRAPFRLSWLEHDAPVGYLDSLDREPSDQDILVVPEVLAAAAARLPFAWRRVVFVQGSFLVPAGLGGAADYRELGYELALAVLPHVAAVVERHFGLRAEVTPPFVAPYFFRDREEIARRPRRPIILLVAKPEYRRAGFPDYDIFDLLVRRPLEAEDSAGERGRGGRAPDELVPPGRAEHWRVIELDGSLPHREVASLMAEASFLVNLNTHEAFNTTVPEAMAAGCLPLCYDAFGGRDFLVDGENALVFPNHHIYPLVEKTLELIGRGGTAGGEGEGGRRGEAADLSRMRLAARDCAGRYDVAATRAALERVFPARLAAKAPR